MGNARGSSNGVREPKTTRIGGVAAKALPSTQPRGAETVSVIVRDGSLPEATTEEAAKVLVEHLFAQNDVVISGISYAVSYKLAEGPTGGDIVDLYQYDNDSIAFSIADISGKGPHAAVNAALIKFGLRAYSSEGLTPERVIRAMDRLYLENNAFEKIDSFASVFFGIVDPTRRLMTYTNAGHEPVVLVFPDGSSRILIPTAPLVGVFDDEHHLFRQSFADLPAGVTEVMVIADDGARFSHHLVYRAAKQNFQGYHHWPKHGENELLQHFIAADLTENQEARMADKKLLRARRFNLWVDLNPPQRLMLIG